MAIPAMVMNTPKIFDAKATSSPGVLQFLKVEGEGERAPDIVGDAVAEDQAENDDHAPADAPHQLGKREDQRRIGMVGRALPSRHSRIIGLEDIFAPCPASS